MKSLLGQEADFCVIKVADLPGMASELKVLGVFSPERISEFPDVPTLGELGYYGAWLGASRCIVAPAGVSDEVVSFYEAAFKAAMNDSDYLAEASLDGITTNFMDAADTEEWQYFCRERERSRLHIYRHSHAPCDEPEIYI